MLYSVFIFACFLKTNNEVNISVFMFGNLMYTHKSVLENSERILFC